MTTDSAGSDRIAEAYREKLEHFETGSGLPVKGVYGPDDVEGLSYERDLNDPGAYPYTRGIYPDMYRGRLWSRRQLCGFGSPSATNQRIKYLIGQGESAVNIAFDVPTNSGVDSDHPLARGDVGLQGMPVSILPDMEEALADIPLDKVSVNLSTIGATMIMAFYLVAARRRGFDFRQLRGTVLNDTLGDPFCGYKRSFVPTDLALKLAIDCVEYCVREVPKWNPLSVDGYNIRENGVTAPQEIAFTFALGMAYLREGLDRGLDIEELAPRITFTASVEMDFFEEVAKLRAARRLWARIIHDEFGGRTQKALQYKFHVHTAGSSLTRQQPLNNLIRVTIEAMAGVLGGTQSLHTCSYDENMGLPTEESVELAVRTQQIIAFESRVCNVADPLAGSYFVEHLTDTMEGEIRKILGEIEDLGGMVQALETGWADAVIDGEVVKVQRQIESGERPVVGVNRDRTERDDEQTVRIHEVPPAMVEGHIRRLGEYKQQRDGPALEAALAKLRADAEGRSINLFPAAMAAIELGATLGELNGNVRLGFGYSYDDLSGDAAA
ncbi:MAG: methylmalonyl-CoA mutase family protein [Alphaproteobacteria bacterium]|jgi:methylmalonyl-CoA mutase N-terminal domain/subunit|nr:methylmalonyl-CoA mutase family protein [Alphaproteobacteria bacterium]MDP6814120.1 methylmalonyl-CoA mutase family protein [Alphaproteobacteria bacterium]